MYIYVFVQRGGIRGVKQHLVQFNFLVFRPPRMRGSDEERNVAKENYIDNNRNRLL